MKYFASIRSFFSEMLARFLDHEVSRMSAALSYYAVFSLSPLLIILVGIVGIVFGTTEAERVVLSEASAFLGREGEETLRSMMASNDSASKGGVFALLGFVLLLVGAASVFKELKSSLNRIFDIAEKKVGFFGFLKQNFFSFGMVIATGFLLLVSLVLTAVLSFLLDSASYLLPIFPAGIWSLLSGCLSFLLIFGIFALLFRFIPDTRFSWKPILRGALFTAVLFVIGKTLLGLYLGRSGAVSSSGAAGSILLILLWIYYSSHILFLGAEAVAIFATSPRKRSL